MTYASSKLAKTLATLAIVTLVHVAYAPDAAALSCEPVGYLLGPLGQAPADTKVWAKLDVSEVATASLRAEPESVAVTGWSDIVLAGGAVVRAYTLSGLEPGLEVTVHLDGVSTFRGALTFSVTADSAAPAEQPLLVGTSYVSSESEPWGSSEYIAIDWTAPGGHIVLMAKSGDEQLDEASVTGSVTASMSSYPANTFLLGKGLCFAQTWDPSKEATTVQLGAYNLAGQFSGWSDPIAVATEDSGGCSGGRSSTAPAGIAMVLLVLWRFRQRPVRF